MSAQNVKKFQLGPGRGMSFEHLTKRPHAYTAHPHKVIDRTFIAHAVAQMALKAQLKKLRIATLPSVDWENEILLDTGLKQCGIRGLYHGIEPNLTKPQAEKRLKQVEMFSKMNKKK
jgi:hypothetical protein